MARRQTPFVKIAKKQNQDQTSSEQKNNKKQALNFMHKIVMDDPFSNSKKDINNGLIIFAKVDKSSPINLWQEVNKYIITNEASFSAFPFDTT